MSTAVPLVIAGLGTVALAAGSAFYWLRMRRADRRRAWSRVGERLGLEVMDREIRGRVDGQSILVQHGVLASRVDSANTLFSPGFCAFWEPPMDLGLRVLCPSGSERADNDREPAKLIAMHGGSHGLLSVSADEDVRSRALLSPEVLQRIEEVAARALRLEISDRTMYFVLPGQADDEAWLVREIQELAKTSGLLHQARQSVPTAKGLARCRDAWREFAEFRGLRFLQTPLCVWGTLDGVAVQARASRVAPAKYDLVVQARLDVPLGIGLRVRAKGKLDTVAALLGGEDRLLGDEAFDGAFLVWSTVPSSLERILDADTRKTMLDARASGYAIGLDDEWVSLSGRAVPEDPQNMTGLVSEVAALARRLSSAARRGPSVPAGPYR